MTDSSQNDKIQYLHNRPDLLQAFYAEEERWLQTES